MRLVPLLKRVLSAILALGLAACEVRDTKRVESYLRETFPKNGDSMKYENGLSEPTLLASPVLRRLLPNTRFYRATLRTPHYEYPEVKTLIAATRTGDVTEFRYRFSTTYNDQQPNFTEVFTGIQAANPADRIEVARAIGDLFAAITYEGRIGSVGAENRTIVVDLWHGDQLWHHIVVKFDSTNTIESVELRNPKGA